MEQQNMEYLGETWNQTADALAIHGEEIIHNSLPQPLQKWVAEQINNQTEIFLSVQAVGTSINALGQYLIIKNIINTFHWTA